MTIIRQAYEKTSLEEARFWAYTGLLSSLALALGFIETALPLPLPFPGVKLGLPNAIILAALLSLDGRSAACIAVIKVLVVGFLFSSLVMIPYSAAGTFLATLGMALLCKIPIMNPSFIAIGGAILHNAGQLVVASMMLGSIAVWAAAPVLFLSACITGAITGWIARKLARLLKEEMR